MSKEVVIFKNGELELEVTVSENRENVWLSQDQMATLFDVDRSRVTRHIKISTMIMNWMKIQHVRKTHLFKLKEKEKSNVLLRFIILI